LAAKEADRALRFPGVDIRVHEPSIPHPDENTLTPLKVVTAMDRHDQTKLV
jgi:hypothetical protein